MGEYEPPRERPEDGGLYPLNAEVTNTLMMVMMSKDDHDNLMKIMTMVVWENLITSLNFLSFQGI